MGHIMKTNEREAEIMNILKERKFISVQALSDELYTSPSSIRRSLTRLEAGGLVKRSYGGVLLCDDGRTAACPDVRLEKQKDEKKRIAKKAAALLHDDMTVFLDGSTTAGYLAEHIPEFHGITVFTNNIRTAAALIEKAVNTYFIGGYLKGFAPVAVGNFAEQMIDGLNADIFFFSSLALSDDGVISDCSPEETSLRSKMFSHSRKRIFLCDSSKFHRISTFRLCTLDDVDAFISDCDQSCK